MPSRRLVWVGAAAIAALWFARSARAKPVEEIVSVEPVTPVPQAPAAAPPAAAAAPRRAAFSYAAESARTATRLPPEERGARGFLRAAAVSSQFELQASRLAAERAQSEAVRAYAAELQAYQETAHLDLLRLLHGRAMAPPMMDNAQRKALQKLAKLQGPAFDREYVELLGRRQQREDVQQFERAALGVSDPVLRGWIDRQLPSLRAQEAAAQRLAFAGRRPGEGVRPTPVAARADAKRQRAE